MSGGKEVYFEDVPSLIELWDLIDEGKRFTIIIKDKEIEEHVNGSYE